MVARDPNLYSSCSPEECEVCFFRDQIKPNKGSLVVFLMILSFFSGMLVMFFAMAIAFSNIYIPDSTPRKLPKQDPHIVQTPYIITIQDKNYQYEI